LIKYANQLGIDALSSNDFKTSWFSIIITGIFNLICMTVMTIITYFKPFGKIKKNKKVEMIKS
ncbi:hypothetical protein V7056_14230, partial [Bacillus sp. JJ664]